MQRGQNWSWNSGQRYWDDKPYIAHLKVPDFNGDVKEFTKYSWLVTNLKTQVSPKDYKYLVPQLVAALKGPIATDLEQMQLEFSQF